jgi:hypothetical protein
LFIKDRVGKGGLGLVSKDSRRNRQIVNSVRLPEQPGPSKPMAGSGMRARARMRPKDSRTSNVTNDPARQSAQGISDSDMQQVVDARRSGQRAEASKTTRLHELRLAKDAADRENAERQRATGRPTSPASRQAGPISGIGDPSGKMKIVE